MSFQPIGIELPVAECEAEACSLTFQISNVAYTKPDFRSLLLDLKPTADAWSDDRGSHPLSVHLMTIAGDSITVGHDVAHVLAQPLQLLVSMQMKSAIGGDPRER